MHDLGVSYTFHFHKKNTESSVIFLRNAVLILNGKGNKESSAICFEIRIPKKNKESFVIFLRNDVLILNGKENKEATAICFEIRILKKKNKELLRKVPSKIYEVILLWKKTKKKFGLLIFPNINTEQWGYSLFKKSLSLFKDQDHRKWK